LVLTISRQVRSQLIDLSVDYEAKVRIVYLEVSEDERARRNLRRQNPVPAKAIARMLDRWEPPDLTECHALDVVLG
jgi:tRNA uridine 5-carbamoylmethylation protein Kti12